MSKRKAWNEAMRSAAGGNLQIPGLAPQPNRATRNKRREKARKAINIGSSSSADIVAYRIDGLEEAGANVEDEDIEEEFDELEEMDKGRKRRRKSAGTGRGKTKAGAIDKRFKPRSLAAILIEESGRSDSVVQDYLDAEARPVKGKSLGNYPARKFCPVTGLAGELKYYCLHISNQFLIPLDVKGIQYITSLMT